jgi:hypothetical protein
MAPGPIVCQVRMLSCAPMPPGDTYAALDAFLTQHRLCRPGLDDPVVTGTLVSLACECGAVMTARLPPMPARA